MKNTISTTWETRIEPIETALILLTPAGHVEAARLKADLDRLPATDTEANATN